MISKIKEDQEQYVDLKRTYTAKSTLKFKLIEIDKLNGAQ